MKNTLNIISDSVGLNAYGGPNKVVNNTIKGLQILNYPYVINNDPGNFRLNWVHDSIQGLIEVTYRKIPAIVGPNIAVLPVNLPVFRRSLRNCIYLHPSQWCIDLWNSYGFNECALMPWPAGIDLEAFRIKRGPECEGNVLIYFKRRDHKLLEYAINEVKRTGLIPTVIKYGEYNEDQYKKALSNSSFGIWIGISESQGIGLQEALASGLPLIVCDVNSLFESADMKDYVFPKTLKNFKPTSAPYFDKGCGIIINDFSNLAKAIRNISGNLSAYHPAEYIYRNLSLEKQALELLSFFKMLEQNRNPHFSKPIIASNSKNFSLSIYGRLAYILFLFRRKLKTLVRIVNNKSPIKV
jgi:hypothetical protein